MQEEALAQIRLEIAIIRGELAAELGAEHLA